MPVPGLVNPVLDEIDGEPQQMIKWQPVIYASGVFAARSVELARTFREDDTVGVALPVALSSPRRVICLATRTHNPPCCSRQEASSELRTPIGDARIKRKGTCIRQVQSTPPRSPRPSRCCWATCRQSLDWQGHGSAFERDRITERWLAYNNRLNASLSQH